MRLRRERIEQIRRSLAMSPSLPRNVVEDLLEEIETLAGKIDSGRDDLERLAAELNEVLAKLRR